MPDLLPTHATAVQSSTMWPLSLLWMVGSAYVLNSFRSAYRFDSFNQWFRSPPSHIEQPIPEHLRHNFDVEDPSLLARDSPMLLRKQKACPVCRTPVGEAPIEAWGLKDILNHLFAHKSIVAEELYPEYDRPVEPNALPALSEAWKGVFRKTAANRAGAMDRGDARAHADGPNATGAHDRGFFDEEDNVYRCTDCYHEIWEGLCSSCGRAYFGFRDPLDDDEDEEIDGGTWMDADGFDDEVFEGGLDPVGDDNFADAGEGDVVDLDGIIGVLGHARRFLRDNGVGPRRQRQGHADEDESGEDEEEHEVEEGYESSFIDDDDMHPVAMEVYHSAEEDEGPHPRRRAARVGDDSTAQDEEEDDDGALTEDSERRARRNLARRGLPLPLRRGRGGNVARIQRRGVIPTINISDDDEEEEEEEDHTPPRRARRAIAVESDSEDGGTSRVNRVFDEDEDEDEDDAERYVLTSFFPIDCSDTDPRFPSSMQTTTKWLRVTHCSCYQPYSRVAECEARHSHLR